MEGSIRIIEKPEWISWEEIRQCLYTSHTHNREEGIRMIHSDLPAKGIQEKVGNGGIMWVVLDGRKLIGTAALLEREGNTWYAPGRYAYLCFDGFLPEYNGKGIYKSISAIREEYARNKGLSVLVFNTHEKNKRIQAISSRNGFSYVRYLMSSNRDHFDVYMAKWLGERPFSESYCRFRFRLSFLRAHLRKWISDIVHLSGRSK